jgi:hypothetical protein
MADSYSDFLNLAKTLNIPLNSNSVSTIAPTLGDSQSELDKALSDIVGNIKKAEFSKSQGQAMGDASGIMANLMDNSEYNKPGEDDIYTLYDLARDMENQGIITLNPTDNMFTKNMLTKKDMEMMQALRSDEAYSPGLYDGLDIELKDKPTVPSNDGDVVEDEGVKVTEEEEDERPKGLKDYLKDIMSDGDSLIALGSAIARGEGLVGGLEDFNEARKATKALEREIAEQEFERARQAKLDEYTIATAISDIAYKQSQLTTDEVKNAQSAAYYEAIAEEINPDDPNISAEDMKRYYQILNKKMDMIINKEKPMTIGTLADQIAMGAVTGGETTTGAIGQGNNQITVPYTEFTQ